MSGFDFFISSLQQQSWLGILEQTWNSQEACAFGRRNHSCFRSLQSNQLTRGNLLQLTSPTHVADPKDWSSLSFTLGCKFGHIPAWSILCTEVSIKTEISFQNHKSHGLAIGSLAGWQGDCFMSPWNLTSRYGPYHQSSFPHLLMGVSNEKKCEWLLGIDFNLGLLK